MRHSPHFSNGSAPIVSGESAAMADKLADMGKPIDRQALLASRAPGTSLGRPMVARALVKAGHVADAREAFDQLIGEGRPAFVPRVGPATG